MTNSYKISRIKSDKVYFFVYLLEKYAAYKSRPTNEVLKEWNDFGLINYINDMYEQYHSERIENAFEDIDRKYLEIAANSDREIVACL